MPVNWPRKLKQLRAAHNYKQEYLAEELGIRQNTYSLWESGTTELTMDRLEQVGRVYDMSLEEMEAWEPGAVHQSHNNVANAYTTVEHQHATSQEFMQEMMSRFDKSIDESARMNEELLHLNQRLMDVVERLSGKAE
jgi:transcriptional regulator with XRE-family HTH domain